MILFCAVQKASSMVEPHGQKTIPFCASVFAVNVVARIEFDFQNRRFGLLDIMPLKVVRNMSLVLGLGA